MSRSLIRFAVVAVLLVVSAACGGTDHPTAPTVTTPRPPVVTAPTGPTGFPPIVKPARIFGFDHQLSYPVMEYTKESRYVLYDDGSFALQYATFGGEYDGSYQQAANGALTLVFQGAGWRATGSVQGGALSVQYNTDMSLSDFEDAVYAIVNGDRGTM